MASSEILDDAVHIERAAPPDLPHLPRGATILTGPNWKAGRDGGLLLSQASAEGWDLVTIEADDLVRTPWVARVVDGGQVFDMRDPDGFFAAIGAPTHACIDINTLGLSIWAPALRALHARKAVYISAIYARPQSYKLRASGIGPVHSPEYDFNATALGVGPVAGFTRLPAMAYQDAALLVALLGLEGKRAQVALRELGDPTPETKPVFALPGYSRRLAHRAIWAHREFLEATESSSALEYLSPTNPFAVQRFIQERINYFDGRHIYVMPLATKPMNLGAVLACLLNPSRTELVFDHSVKGDGDAERIHAYYLYDLTDALSSGAGAP